MLAPDPSARPVPPRVHSAPVAHGDDIEQIFSSPSYLAFLHEGDASAGDTDPALGSHGVVPAASFHRNPQHHQSQHQPQQPHPQEPLLSLQQADASPGLPQRPYTSAAAWEGSSASVARELAASDVSCQLQRKREMYELSHGGDHNHVTAPVAGRTVASVPVDLLDQIAQVTPRWQTRPPNLDHSPAGRASPS
jgi:hypothetical protein